MSLNIFLLRKYRPIFELRHCFILFLSISDTVSVKASRNWILVSYKLMLVMALHSTNGFFCLIIRVFNIFQIFRAQLHILWVHFRFLVKLSHYWTVELKKHSCRETHNVGKKACLDMLLVKLFLLNSLCFLGWDRVISQNFKHCFCLCLFLSVFCCCTPYTW